MAYKVIKAKDLKDLADQLNKQVVHSLVHIQPKAHADKIGYEALVYEEDFVEVDLTKEEDEDNNE